MNQSSRIVRIACPVAAAVLVACAASPSPEPGPAASTPSVAEAAGAHPDAVVPATGASLALGIVSWKVFVDSSSGPGAWKLRTVGVDASNATVAVVAIEVAGRLVTIQDVSDDRTFQVRTDGTVVLRPSSDSARTSAVLGALNGDLQVYKAAHEHDVAFDCAALAALADATCALVYPTCITPEPAEPLACTAAVIACAGATYELNECLESCTGCSCPGATCPDGYSCTNGTCTQVCSLFGECGNDSCGNYIACPSGQECLTNGSYGQCCTPEPCGPSDCGEFSDGCGNTQQCSNCSGSGSGGGGSSGGGSSGGGGGECSECADAYPGECDTGVWCFDFSDCLPDGYSCDAYDDGFSRVRAPRSGVTKGSVGTVKD